MRVLLTFLLCIFLVLACSQNSMSDRDQKLNQQTSAAETKRAELRLVEGSYTGTLLQSDGLKHSVSLKLDLRDVPTTVEGSVDPILVPTLSGYLKFHFGESLDTGEYINFTLTKSEFNAKSQHVDLIVENEHYKNIILSLTRADGVLSGTWSAPALSVSGTVEFKKPAGALTPPLLSSLKGSYQGELKNTNSGSNLPENLFISLVTIQDEADFKLSGNMRFYLGPFGSSEFVEVPFSEVQYQPFLGKVFGKTSGEYKFVLKADYSRKIIKGNLYSDALGEVATIEVNKL